MNLSIQEPGHEADKASPELWTPVPRAEPDGELTRTCQGRPPWGGQPPNAVPEWQAQLSAIQRTPQGSHQERWGVPRGKRGWHHPDPTEQLFSQDLRGGGSE